MPAIQSVKKEYQTQFLDLLNAVSDKVEIARVGNDKKREVFQVKVVLAINEDLGELLRTDRLRHDLFYRIRRIIRFKTLRERLSDPETNRADLMVLLMTYRWRLAPRIQQSSRDRMVDGTTVDDLSASRLHAMFAQFEEAAIDAMLRHDWPGNLRELERVACDLFCDADQRLDSTIKYEHVMQVIAEFFIPQPTQGAVQLASVSAIAESTRVILASVERALRQQRFNIGSILDGLKVYKLGSRPTLRRFLVKHKDLLSADIAAESKVQRFMQTRE
jgi:transcriptional regulator with PAS, ATPase and Fis domain